MNSDPISVPAYTPDDQSASFENCRIYIVFSIQINECQMIKANHGADIIN